VAQAYHFVVSGNAAAGFVSASLLSEQSEPSLSSCRWVVPPAFHAPISQDLVVLKAGAERAAVQAFTKFLRQDDAARIIREAGYLP
jgi:molybdate transport system substrate-binding protein